MRDLNDPTADAPPAGAPRPARRAGRGLVLALALAALPAAHAATVTVTNTSDENDGNTSSIAALGTGGPDGKISLREAILAANNTAGTNTIVLGTHTYTLSSGLGTITISNAATIQGNGAGSTSISGNNSIRMFSISGSTAVTFTNLTLKNGSAASGDGGAVVNGTGTLTLTSVTLSGNKASAGNGGAITNPSGTLALTSTTFSSNSCGVNGGAIYSAGAISDSGSTFSSNSVTNGTGGALALSGTSAITLTNTTFSSNKTNTGNGGAIAYTGTSTLTLNTVTFSNNSAGGFSTAGAGGAIYSTGNLSLSSVHANGNSANSGDGGAIDLVSGSFTDSNGVYGSTSSNQTNTSGNGGTLLLSGSSAMSLTGTSISSGQSAGNGGAIAYTGSSTLTLNTVTLSNNQAGQSGGDGGGASGYGGAIYNSAGSLSLTSVTASGNQSGLDGGAIDSLAGTLSDTNGNYSSNSSSSGNGGAINLATSASSATLSGTTLTSNTAHTAGGGIAVAGSASLSLSNGATVQSGNANSGGGISFQSSSTLTITDSTIASNSTNGGGNGGGGLYMTTGSGTISRSTFASNTASTGGGDGGGCSGTGCGGGAINFQSSSTLTLTNDTLSENVSSNYGGGVLVDGGTLTMMNVTVATNQGSNGAGLARQAGTLQVTNTIIGYNFGGNSCYGTITSGGHNLESTNTCGFGAGNLVNTDPYLAPLASNGGLTQTRALSSDSAAIGAGTSTGAPATDQRSVARNSPPCVGAYEYNGATGTHSSSASHYNAVDGYFASYPAATSGQKIYTKLAGTAFTLDIAALNNATPTPGLQSPAYVSGTNQIRVDLVDDSDGKCASSCSSSQCTSKQALATVFTSFVSGDNSYHTGVSFNVSNVDANVRARILDMSYAPVYGCSVDNFAIRPPGLTISGWNVNADNTGASATATPTVKTGASFTLNVGSTSGYGYNGVPAINLAAITVNPSHAGTLSGSFSSGGENGTQGNFTYSEVGYFSINANAVTDTSYTAVDQSSDCTLDYSNTLVNGKYGCYVANASASSYFGRFIPDHFAIATGSVTPACGTFTYFDQDGFTTAFTLTAQNSSNVTTQNYTGSFARLVLTSWANYVFTGNTATPSASATAPTGSWSNGVANVSAKHQVVVRPTTTPVAPASLIVSAKPVDPDSVTAAVATAVMSAATTLDFGELQVSSASGPSNANLSLPVNANIWNGSGWVTNTADSCTGAAIATANIPVGNFTPTNGGSFSTSVTTPSLASSWSQGAGAIVLAAPNVAGTANVAINLGSGTTDTSCVGWSVTSTGAGLAWLRGAWCGNAGYSQDPSALATFGTATTSTAPFVYIRENH
jgi:predicted outer membrane repeat protein